MKLVCRSCARWLKHSYVQLNKPCAKQPADPTAIPPPSKRKSARTAPKAAQNPRDIDTPDIPESGGGKGRGRGGAKGARTGARSGRGRAKGTGRGRGSGSSRGPGKGRASNKLACNAAESATDADLPALSW
ncbi:TPA: hypothetical protein ACH3X1_014833 [Trebouxia sp. C0004]